LFRWNANDRPRFSRVHRFPGDWRGLEPGVQPLIRERIDMPKLALFCLGLTAGVLIAMPQWIETFILAVLAGVGLLGLIVVVIFLLGLRDFQGY
jgi:hypothetical protein